MALDLGGLREQRIQCIYNLHGRPTWQQVDNVSWSNGYCVGSLKKMGPNTKPGAMTINYIVIGSYKYHIAIVGLAHAIICASIDPQC